MAKSAVADALTMALNQQGARVLLEVDVAALQRLLRCQELSVSEFRSVNSDSKRCVQSVYLELLNQRLTGT